MNTKAKGIWLASLVILPLGAALAPAQEKKPAEASAPKDDPMMAKMKEFGAVGAAHKALESRVGKWNFEMRMYQPGQTEAEPTKGSGEAKWIMGGRFVEETITCDFMGEPFQGRGTTGYDNIKKKYVSTWVDNMGTGIYYSVGTYDAGTKTFAFAGESPDVMAGKYVKSRWVEKWTDNDHYVSQGFKPGPDGKEFMEMEIRCTRAK